MGDVALCSERNEDLLYKLFGKNVLIDHAWGWEPTTIAAIKAYRPSSNSISSGQVLHCPYEPQKAKLVVREMTDLLVLDLVDKGLVTDQMVLTVGYDIENLTDPARRAKYHGAGGERPLRAGDSQTGARLYQPRRSHIIYPQNNVCCVRTCAMSISKYQVFLKTVSCGSFSKAAEAMNFTQSGISHAINSLESELGVKLLSRNRGGVVLTADGRAVLPKIEKLCAAHHSLVQTVEGLKDMDSGLVKIATFSSVSAQWLPRILKSFGELYPNIEFEVVTGDFYDQIEGWIVNGTVDCGFLRLPSVKRLQTYALHRDELQVIVPCDHPYADRDPFPVSALAEEPFIQLEEGDDYEIMAAFDEMGIRPNVKYIAREDRTILAMVSEGLGISLLPELMVRHSPTPIKVCHAPLHFYRTIGIGVKDKKALSNSTRLFVDYVRTWVAENGNT